MTALRALKKLLLGETWVLPLGVGLSLGAAAVLGPAAGPVLVAGVLGALVLSVRRTARRR